MDKLICSQTMIATQPEQRALWNPARLVALFRCWQARRYNRSQLALLDERTMRDIGLTSYEIRREIAKPFWRD